MKKQLAILSILSIVSTGVSYAADYDFTKLVRGNSQKSAAPSVENNMTAEADSDVLEDMSSSVESSDEIATMDETKSGVKKDVEKAYDKSKSGVEQGYDKAKSGTEKAYDKSKSGVEQGYDKAKSSTKKEMDKMDDKLKKHTNDQSCK